MHHSSSCCESDTAQPLFQTLCSQTHQGAPKPGMTALGHLGSLAGKHLRGVFLAGKSALGSAAGKASEEWKQREGEVKVVRK